MSNSIFNPRFEMFAKVLRKSARELDRESMDAPTGFRFFIADAWKEFFRVHTDLWKGCSGLYTVEFDSWLEKETDRHLVNPVKWISDVCEYIKGRD